MLLLRRIRRTFAALSTELGGGASAMLVLRTSFRTGALLSFTWPGLDHEVWVRPGTSDIRSFVEVVIDRVYDWPAGFVPPAVPPALIIDAGANVGYSALWFHARFPQARIIALEPDPDNFALLCRNTAHVAEIECRPQALWNEVTTLDLRPGTSAANRQVRAAGDGVVGDPAMVAAIDLGTLLDELGAGGVDLLKIDIEGAEWEVFADSAGWIDRVTMIAGELHERYRPGVGAVVDEALAGFPQRFDHRYEFFTAR